MGTPTRGIRWHLVQVLLVCIVPIGLFGAALLYLHWQAQEEERERSQVESARLLAAAVDNAVDSTIQRLGIFARLLASRELDPKEVYDQAQRAVAGSPDWDNMLLWTADGNGVFRLDRPYGTKLESMRLPELWKPVVAEHRPVVSDVFVSPYRDLKVIAVGVPVERDGKVTHILMASLRFSWFDALLNKQGKMEPGGVAGIFDRNWKFVARSSEGEARRGTDPSRPLIEDMRQRPEGLGRYPSLDGITVYTSWTPTRHGWWVAYATPAAPVEAAFWRHLALFGLLWLGAMAASIFYALRKGRVVTCALRCLEADAGELARGNRLAELPATRVLEIDRALDVLQRASHVVSVAMHEREHALSVEREARDQAESASRAKDEFLAMLGHELRNPVGAIANSVNILNAGQPTEEQRAFAAGVIGRQSRHLRRIIDDLLDVGRAMTGKITLAREPLDLAASARHVTSALQAGGRLADRRIELELRPAWISGDATRVEQIITNLVTNAASHTAAGGRIVIEVAPEGDEALVRVTDDGAGIAPEHLPRLFELFYQADTSVDRARGGLGIGLTLVQRLAELHGGAVAIESAGRGKGARFTVRFPAIAAPGTAGIRVPGPAEGEKRPMSLI